MDPGTASRLQGIELEGELLIVGTHAGIAKKNGDSGSKVSTEVNSETMTM
jgi:hypothetical protein